MNMLSHEVTPDAPSGSRFRDHYIQPPTPLGTDMAQRYVGHSTPAIPCPLELPVLGRYHHIRRRQPPPALLAQLAEQLTLNQRVVGSSPTGGTPHTGQRVPPFGVSMWFRLAFATTPVMGVVCISWPTSGVHRPFHPPRGSNVGKAWLPRVIRKVPPPRLSPSCPFKTRTCPIDDETVPRGLPWA